MCDPPNISFQQLSEKQRKIPATPLVRTQSKSQFPMQSNATSRRWLREREDHFWTGSLKVGSARQAWGVAGDEGRRCQLRRLRAQFLSGTVVHQLKT